MRRHEHETPSMVPTPDYIVGFLAAAHSLALSKAFMDIKDRKLRRRFVDLVEEIVSVRDHALTGC